MKVFMQQAQTDLFTLPLPTFALKVGLANVYSLMASMGIISPLFFQKVTGVRSWRTKQRDAKLMTMYAALVPRMIEAEKVLRGIIG